MAYCLHNFSSFYSSSDDPNDSLGKSDLSFGDDGEESHLVIAETERKKKKQFSRKKGAVSFLRIVPLIQIAIFTSLIFLYCYMTSSMGCRQHYFLNFIPVCTA